MLKRALFKCDCMIKQTVLKPIKLEQKKAETRKVDHVEKSNQEKILMNIHFNFQIIFFSLN